MTFKVGDKIRTICPTTEVTYDHLESYMYNRTGEIKKFTASNSSGDGIAYHCTIINTTNHNGTSEGDTWTYYVEELVLLGPEYRVYRRK